MLKSLLTTVSLETMINLTHSQIFLYHFLKKYLEICRVEIYSSFSKLFAISDIYLEFLFEKHWSMNLNFCKELSQRMKYEPIPTNGIMSEEYHI